MTVIRGSMETTNQPQIFWLGQHPPQALLSIRYGDALSSQIRAFILCGQ